MDTRMLIGMILISNGVLFCGILYMGRQLRKIRALLNKGAEQIADYMAVVMNAEEEAVPAFLSEAERQQATEEKKMLFSFDPEPVLKEFIGDIL